MRNIDESVESVESINSRVVDAITASTKGNWGEECNTSYCRYPSAKILNRDDGKHYCNKCRLKILYDKGTKYPFEFVIRDPSTKFKLDVERLDKVVYPSFLSALTHIPNDHLRSQAKAHYMEHNSFSRRRELELRGDTRISDALRLAFKWSLSLEGEGFWFIVYSNILSLEEYSLSRYVVSYSSSKKRKLF